MKILEVRYIAFGPFTDRTIRLEGGHEGLHIIYGPNEAGKSSALRGLRQLLYGIPERSPDDFIHPYRKIRIGGILKRGDGPALEFIRRKARSNSLRAPNDVDSIDDSELHRFLGGVDAELFARMFGIDHSGLVQGGQEIVRGGGDLGHLLFAAGSGIADLRRLREELQSECDSLFKPSGTKPRINEAIRELQNTQKAMREAQLSSQDWLKHEEALRTAQEEKAGIERLLDQKQREKNRMERIQQALPIISRRKACLEALDLCEDAVLLPADFGTRRREAVTHLKVAEKEKADAVESCRRIEGAINKRDVPEKLLQNAEWIEHLHKGLGIYQKAAKDRSHLVIQQQVLQDEAAAMLSELNRSLSPDEAERIKLGKAESVRIQELGNACERLTTRRDSTQEDIDRLTLRIEKLKEQLCRVADSRDTGELKRLLNRVRRHGDIEASCVAERQSLLTMEREARIELRKLDPWTGTLEDLEKLPLPSFEVVDLFESRLRDADDSLKKSRNETAEAERAALQLSGQIERLRIEQEVPTEEELHAARGKRDEEWQVIRRIWELNGKPAEQLHPSGDLYPRAKELADAFELTVRKADELADRLRREADRVAQKARLLAERKTLKAQLDRLAGELEAATAARARIHDEWCALWTAIGIPPRSPREMRAWLLKQAALVDRAEGIRERRARVEMLERLAEGYRGELLACLEALGETAAEGERLSSLIERAQDLVDSLEKVGSRREQISHELNQRQGELAAARKHRMKAEEQLQAWRLDWAEAVRKLGLDASSSPGQAGAVLQDLKEISMKLKEARALQRRVEEIDKEAGEFSLRIRSTVERLAPEISRYSIDEACVELYSRLAAARTAKAHRETLEAQLRNQKDRVRDARERIDLLESQLFAMCRDAGCRGWEDLPAAEERSARKQELLTQFGQLQEQLLELTAGATIEELALEVQSLDPDGIGPTVERLEEEIEALIRQKSVLDQTIGSERTELARMDGRAHAADLAEEAQTILTRLEFLIEQYARVKIASHVLDQAIEDFRERHQDPILKRASEFFALMTLGSFEGLRVELTGKAQPLLVGVRAGGKETVRVEGMSDGTADQLYFALRLAAIEDFLDRNEPIPFIADDVLVRFDDARAAAALQILAQLAGRTQVIFFTHHRHLVELAARHLTPDVLFTHALGC